MICPNCGTNNSDSTKFCITCGTRMDVDPGAQEQQQQTYQQPPQQPYQPPVAAPVVQPSNAAPLTTGQFFLMDLICLIPIVGLVMYFVWAFGDSNLNRKSWAKAKLIWALISIVFWVILIIIIASTGMYLLNDIRNSVRW